MGSCRTPDRGGTGKVHKPVSQYIDSLLQPYVRRTPTFLLDTTDFIRKIEGTSIPPDSLIFSFDVVSLYINIPHDELRTTLQEVFASHESPPPHFLLDFVDILPEKNYYRYDRRYYLQIKGVAMDSTANYL